jgi:hypothetical protein
VGSAVRAGTNNEFQPSAGPTNMSSICTNLKDQSLESQRLENYQPHTLKTQPSSGSPVGVQVAGVTAPPATAQQATAAAAPPATAQQATAASVPRATADRVQATSSTFSSVLLKVVSFRSFKNVFRAHVLQKLVALKAVDEALDVIPLFSRCIL